MNPYLDSFNLLVIRVLKQVVRLDGIFVLGFLSCELTLEGFLKKRLESQGCFKE